MTRSEMRTTASGAVQVGVHEAKTRLSQLLRLVDMGQEVEILRSGRPVARLVPAPGTGRRELGFDQETVIVPEDFDDPLPADVLAGFER